MRRRTVLLAGIGAVVAPASALALHMIRVHPTFSAPRTTGEPGAVPMIDERFMPQVSATIGGKGPFILGIDTGAAGQLHLASATADAVGASVIGKVMVSDPTGRNPVTMSRYTPQSVTLGGLTLHDLVVDELPPIRGIQLDGLLGMDAFNGLTLTLDFKRRQVGLATATLSPADGLSIFTYPEGPTIRLPLTVGQATVQADLDTGQTRTPIMMPTAWMPKLATHGAPRPIGVAHSVSETIELFAVAVDGPVKVGAVPLPASEVTYPTVADVANIGAQALQAMTVRIDRVSRRVQLID